MGIKDRRRHPQKGRSLVACLFLLAYFIAESAWIPSAYAFPFTASRPTDLTQSEESPVASGLELAAQINNFGGLNVEEVEDLYVVRDSNDPNFLEVFERLPSGGYGRILRYRGVTGAGRSVDLEFIYEDRNEVITMIDHRTGRFLRAYVSGATKPKEDLYPENNWKERFGEMLASQGNPLKFVAPEARQIGGVWPRAVWNYCGIRAVSEFDVWMKRLVRGPPAGRLMP